jgi:hypothetical protein
LFCLGKGERTSYGEEHEGIAVKRYESYAICAEPKDDDREHQLGDLEAEDGFGEREYVTRGRHYDECSELLAMRWTRRCWKGRGKGRRFEGNREYIQEVVGQS